jgi:diguanylate cyclase (GGDEF)-like protein
MAIALERAALLERLQQSARTDELTGLPNRRASEEQLPRELARARRERQSLCVVMLDLEHFKEFNDRTESPGGRPAAQAVRGCLGRSAPSHGHPGPLRR